MRDNYKQFLEHSFNNPQPEASKLFLCDLLNRIGNTLMEPNDISYNNGKGKKLYEIDIEDLPYSEETANIKTEELKKLAFNFYDEFKDVESKEWIQPFVKQCLDIIFNK